MQGIIEKFAELVSGTTTAAMALAITCASGTRRLITGCPLLAEWDSGT